MSLIEKINNLKTIPRGQEEEYEYSSDFLEWFYCNLYREQGFDLYPILSEIAKEPEYECMRELCRDLINFNSAKVYDNVTLKKMYDGMKEWTLENIKKYNQPQ